MEDNVNGGAVTKELRGRASDGSSVRILKSLRIMAGGVLEVIQDLKCSRTKEK